MNGSSSLDKARAAEKYQSIQTEFMSNMTNIRLQNTNDSQLLAENLGARVIQVLTDAISKRGSAYLVVSGGSTPKPLFEYLSKQDIDWSKVTITLADERCVETNNPLSNAKLVREHLLIGHAARANFVSLFDGGLVHTDDQIAAGLKLLALPRYDMVILGMGDDGHTASIFPQAINRDIALDLSSHRLALLTYPVTVDPMRITQSAARLLNTRHLVIHFTGAEKAALFNKIMQSPDSSSWPISTFVEQTSLPVEVFANELTMKGVAA